jgi:sigma-B regulation protein RsbU (phosphoserine phosphatase)
MDSSFVDILIIAFGLLAGALFIDQRRRLRALRREHEEIEGEEMRLFDFLHGLGDALQTDSTEKNMNRFIVRGAVKVVAARGGCLYLLDKGGNDVVPAFRTPECAPLFPLATDLIDEAIANPRKLESYLSLESRPKEDGLLGKCLAGGKPSVIPDLEAEFPLPRIATAANGAKTPVMLAPLAYAGKEIGVLAVTGKSNGDEFSTNDFEVFKSVAEQSSVALGSALIHQRAHEKQQLDQEIKNASEIQKILLPFSPPKLEDFVVSAVNYPAKIVSGDYYDYIPIDADHYGIVIGDVSGKGIPASLIMAMCRSLVRVKAVSARSPAAVLASVNRFIFSDIREDMFVTLAYAILEKDSNRVTLARAGHDLPLLYRKSDHSIEAIQQPGLAVGIDAGEVFERVTRDNSFEMLSGDTLLLYTDGATEAIDRNGVEFGLGAIETALRESAKDGAAAVIDRISGDLRRFLGDIPQNDDITLIALQKR